MTRSPLRLQAAFAALAALSVSACGQQPAAEATTPAAEAKAPQTAVLQAESGPAAAAAPVTVTGRLEAATDAGFPMYFLTIAQEGAPAKELLWNAMDPTLTGADSIDAVVGQTISVTYETRPSIDAYALSANGAELLGMDQAAIPAGTDVKELTGTLSGAAETTAGDLPDEITVTGADGTAVTFQFFISPEIAAVNGQSVTLRYANATEDVVTAVRAGS